MHFLQENLVVCSLLRGLRIMNGSLFLDELLYGITQKSPLRPESVFTVLHGKGGTAERGGGTLGFPH